MLQFNLPEHNEHTCLTRGRKGTEATAHPISIATFGITQTMCDLGLLVSCQNGKLKLELFVPSVFLASFCLVIHIPTYCRRTYVHACPYTCVYIMCAYNM